MDWRVMDWRSLYSPEAVARVEALLQWQGVDEAAKELYDTNGNRAASPAWEQLGDVTRSVWVERALAVAGGELA